MSSRVQFEEWYKRVIYSGACFSADMHGNYASGTCQAHWRAWQASRQALEIVLPDARKIRNGYPESVADDMGFNDGLESCREAIEAAGVRVKP